MKKHSIQFIVSIAKQAGSIAESFRKKRSIKVEFKNKKDLVSEADKAVEDFLIKQILSRYPSDSIFAEESGAHKKPSDYLWIIDPIDGTTSYLHNQHFYSISIALQYKNEIVAGVVYAPVLNELYCAEKSSGAFLNNKKIGVSKTDSLIESVLSTGFACIRDNLKNNNLKIFSTVLPKIREIRRFGSAALDLCLTASARLDGFWELNLKKYDIAAGSIILSEAGGKITDFNGKNQYPQKGTVASNTLIHDQLLKIINLNSTK